MQDHVDQQTYKRLIALCVLPGAFRDGLLRLRKKCAALLGRRQ
jgi:hypothetical protein